MNFISWHSLAAPHPLFLLLRMPFLLCLVATVLKHCDGFASTSSVICINQDTLSFVVSYLQYIPNNWNAQVLLLIVIGKGWLKGGIWIWGQPCLVAGHTLAGEVTDTAFIFCILVPGASKRSTAVLFAALRPWAWPSRATIYITETHTHSVSDIKSSVKCIDTRRRYHSVGATGRKVSLAYFSLSSLS